jgi:DNA-binding NtrC family response regulator
VAALEKPLDINQLLAFFAALQRNRTIAIVDDDPFFCNTLGDILQTRGYNVRKITDPHMDVVKMTDDAQIVLLNMKLNRSNEQEMFQQIRDAHPDLPVLLIAGYRQEMEPTIQKAIQIGAHACFYKPLELFELLDTLAEIQLKTLRKELRQSEK